MDKRLQYEQLIGSKLESLPIPDMQDMIWSRIEAQLDIDMPSDGDGGVNNTPQTPPIFSGPILFGLSVGIIAIATLFIIYKNQNQNKETNTNTPFIERTIQKSSEKPKDFPLSDIEKAKKKSPLEIIESGTEQPIAEPYLYKDYGNPVKLLVDSANEIKENSISNKIITSSNKLDTISAKKKGKGVTEIKDSDYKIIPKGNE